MMRNLLLILIILIPPTSSLAAEKNPLFGSIQGNQYVTPNGKLHITIPFGVSDRKEHFIKDVVYPNALNVYFVNKSSKEVHRVDISYPEKKSLHASVEKRMSQYLGLINRTYPGTSVIVHYDQAGNSLYRYLYKQVSGENVRFHYIQCKPHDDRLVLVWSNFTENEDTPENEDRIISGQHEILLRAQALAKSIK